MGRLKESSGVYRKIHCNLYNFFRKKITFFYVSRETLYSNIKNYVL